MGSRTTWLGGRGMRVSCCLGEVKCERRIVNRGFRAREFVVVDLEREKLETEYLYFQEQSLC